VLFSEAFGQQIELWVSDGAFELATAVTQSTDGAGHASCNLGRVLLFGKISRLQVCSSRGCGRPRRHFVKKNSARSTMYAHLLGSSAKSHRILIVTI